MECREVREETCEMPDSPILTVETLDLGEVELSQCCLSFNTSTMFMNVGDECRLMVFMTCTLEDDNDPNTDDTIVKMDDQGEVDANFCG